MGRSLNPERPLRILLVEDDSADQELFRLAVRKYPFQLTITSTLLEALRSVTSSDFDVIFTDLHLPDSQGMETFYRIHALAPQVAIIVLTGSSDDPLGLKLVQDGAQDYLIKGQVDSHSLVRATRYAVERKLAAERTALLAAELAQKNAQMEKELLMAREVQQAFLPHQYPTFPHGAEPSTSAVHFCHRYCPAGPVGGDFFDVIALSDWEAAVLICDVMGHGVCSALITGTIRTLIENVQPYSNDPGELLSVLNRELRTLLRRMDTIMFASAFYLIVDLKSGQLRFANAGHPYPFHLQSRHCTVDSLRPTNKKESGPALGIAHDVRYITSQRPFDQGDRLFLFTDGLFDIEGPNQKYYSLQQIQQSITQRAALPSPRLLDELVEDSRRFAGEGGLTDDVCLIGIDILGRPFDSARAVQATLAAAKFAN